MPNLPIFQSDNMALTQMQNKWKSELTPVITNAINQGQLLSNISIVTGANTINHKLSRQLVGYIIVDQNASATMYRSAPLNDKTLTLTSTGDCVISLWVF